MGGRGEGDWRSQVPLGCHLWVDALVKVDWVLMGLVGEELGMDRISVTKVSG